MQNELLKLYVRVLALRESLKDESGQDLVEYALVLAVVVLMLVAGAKGMATTINGAFATVAGNIQQNMS